MYINYQSKHTCVYETVLTHVFVHARYLYRLLPHMARFANFCDIVLGFVLRAMSGSDVCVFHACLSSLPNALKTVGSCVSQRYFYVFSSNVPCNDSNFWDQTTALLAKTPFG